MFCRVFVKNKYKQIVFIVKKKHNKKNKNIGNYMKTIADRIRQVRGHLTQKEFAELIGITAQAVINYEVRGRHPKGSVIKTICNVFKINEAWLLTGEGAVYSADAQKKMADMSAIPPSPLPAQPIENVSLPIQKMADMSAIAPLYEENRSLYQKNMELQERLLSLTEQNAELRLQLQARDMRIRELEKENAQLRESRKGVSPVFRAATGEAN